MLAIWRIGVWGREFYHRVPRSRAQRHRIVTHAQTAHPVIVTLQCSDPLTAKHIPHLYAMLDKSHCDCLVRIAHLALKIIVASK